MPGSSPGMTKTRDVLGPHSLGEPADQREGNAARQRAHALQKACDLRRKGDLVGPPPELLENFPRASLLAHRIELLLRVVGGIERRIDKTRIDDGHVDARSREFELQTFGEIDHRRLACAIATVLRPARIAEQRAHDGDVARFPREHCG